MATNRTRTPPPEPTSLQVVGALLALGVIRLLERDRHLDTRTEERVSTGVLTTKENARD